MDTYIQLASDEQRLYCEQAQDRLGFPAPTIEKDFWVCWTLRELFQLPDWGPQLTFKGGTSLSKGWKLIKRFSEDIDVVIDRGFLGFGTDQNPTEGDSNNEIKRKLGTLKAICSGRIQAELLPQLRERFKARLPSAAKWQLEMAPVDEDPDLQTILFTYPSVFPSPGDYLRPVVKIEMGARSDHEPSAAVGITPYLAEVFPDAFPGSTFAIKTLASERTFLEKASLVHEETFRKPDKIRKKGMARHYYDLWAMITQGVGDLAIENPELFAQIAEHRKIYFRWTWVDYDTLKPGLMCLVPPAEHLDFWRRDYDEMRQEMFSGNAPDFDEMMRVIAEFEKKWNGPHRH